MSKVLITGTNGFIGSKTAQLFQQKGHEVIGWDRNAGNGKINTYRVDLNEEKEIDDALRGLKPEIVVHCAGCANVGESVRDPKRDYEGNVSITHNLLFSLHKAGLDNLRFVFLSSAGVYGNPESLPIREDAPLKPMSPYAVHKVMCEELCNYFRNNYGMDIKIARIFSAYGAGLRKQIFWDMYTKYNSTGRLEMFGTGEESRDYIHVNDVVNALYLLATVKSKYTVFNVANGEEVTTREATEFFANSIGADKDRIQFNGVVREGDPLNWKADINRIQKLGYRRTERMEEALQDYVEWLRSIE